MLFAVKGGAVARPLESVSAMTEMDEPLKRPLGTVPLGAVKVTGRSTTTWPAESRAVTDKGGLNTVLRSALYPAADGVKVVIAVAVAVVLFAMVGPALETFTQ